MNNYATIIVAIIVALPGIISLFLSLREKEATVAEVITKASEKLINQYGTRIEELEQEIIDLKCEIAELRKLGTLREKDVNLLREQIRIRDMEILRRDERIERLLRGIERLMAQIISHNLKPVWKPSDENGEALEDKSEK